MPATLIDDDEFRELVVSALTEKLSRAEVQRAELDDEINRLGAKLAYIQSYVPKIVTAVITRQEEPSVGKRMKRGEPERIISEFLTMRGGLGASQDQIVDATGVARSTVHRTLGILVARNVVEQTSMRDFRWKALSPSAQAYVEWSVHNELVNGHQTDLPVNGNGKPAEEGQKS